MFSKQDQDMKSKIEGELIQYWKSEIRVDVMYYQEMVLSIVERKLPNICIWNLDHISRILVFSVSIHMPLNKKSAYYIEYFFS